MASMETKYAQLLVDYCLDIQKGDKFYIKTTPLAQPLLKEVYREAIKKGAMVVVDLEFDEKNKIFFEEASDDQLAFISPIYVQAMESYDAYLVIRAPYTLIEDKESSSESRKKRLKHMRPVMEKYFERTGNGEMKRTLCQYPTQANADEAGMSLEEYGEFIYEACRLNSENPREEWLKVRANQQKIVDFLNQCDMIRYRNQATDISFSVKGRKWINSDGRTNMPSGEVFTGPVEDSVNGKVHFDYPSIYMGKEVSGITLEVKDGYIEKWSAEVGGDILDRVFSIEGARRFGEVAIGTNYNITRATKNILFDEKIGGTIHMAVGQSYKQTGAKNSSAIHWDMIADMQQDATIEADGKVIYGNGVFLI